MCGNVMFDVICLWGSCWKLLELKDILLGCVFMDVGCFLKEGMWLVLENWVFLVFKYVL